MRTDFTLEYNGSYTAHVDGRRATSINGRSNFLRAPFELMGSFVPAKPELDPAWQRASTVETKILTAVLFRSQQTSTTSAGPRGEGTANNADDFPEELRGERKTPADRCNRDSACSRFVHRLN